MQQQAQLSALFDNELTLEQQEALLADVLADQALQQQMVQYQLIRDVLQASYTQSTSSLAESC